MDFNVNKTLNDLITKIENSLDNNPRLGSVRENRVVFFLGEERLVIEIDRDCDHIQIGEGIDTVFVDYSDLTWLERRKTLKRLRKLFKKAEELQEEKYRENSKQRLEMRINELSKVVDKL